MEPSERDKAPNDTASTDWSLETGKETEDNFLHDAVPLRFVGTVRVRFRFAGRPKPLAYPIDEVR